MSIELTTLAQEAAKPAGGPGLQAGYGISLTDLGGFENALHSSQFRLEAQPVKGPSEGLQAMAKPLEYVDNEAASLAEHAANAKLSGQAMTPGEMVMFSVRCQTFMFHCQLTSNVANRASDGVQQLFRQQS
jgi:hypothetical protein